MQTWSESRENRIFQMKQLREFPRFIEIITLIGLVLYFSQSWRFAHSLDSIGDEGAYLYKGYLFARGDYHPFQDYAFLTNKAPLAFLIPGYIQLWFGPGLREGRYFSILLGALMVIGIWIMSRRLGGKKWAAVAVWVFALSSAAIGIYSEAVSQVLVACMMAWMFVLTLGEDQPLWQLVLGSALSIIIVMTRQNLVIVPGLLVLYIFWQHGKRAGLWALSTCAILFIGFHMYYWPNILQLWAPWLPSSLTPFLDHYRISTELDDKFFAYNGGLWSSLQSFATGMRDSFFIFFGSASAVVLFPKRDHWKSDSRFKMAVFLGTTFLLLFLMHSLASLFIPYCIFCFSGYQMFYITAGFFFILLVFLNGLNDTTHRQVLLFVILLFFAASLGLLYGRGWSDWLLDRIQLPRVNRIFSRGEFLAVSLRNVLTYSFHIVPDIQKRLASMMGGVFLGAALWIVVWILHHFILQGTWLRRYTFVHTILFCCLLLGTIFPFGVIVQASGKGKCSTNYLSYYEQAGESLSQLIPPGSLVYWRASGTQLALMLYLNNIRIFPPQINAGAGYIVGDSPQILRMGQYNQKLDTEWRDSADILLIWKTFMSPGLLEFLQQHHYEKIQYAMGELARCEDPLFVFRRTQ